MIDSRNPHERPPTPEFDRSRISFDVWMGLHGLENDFADLEFLLKRGGYDIYIPESADRNPEMEKGMNKIVRGDTKTYQRLMTNLEDVGNPIRGMVRAMFASHINLFFADYTEAQLAADEDHQLLNQELPLSRLKNLDEAIAYCNETVQQGFRHYERRDDNIVGNINHELPAFVGQHPRLKDRDDIRALISIGKLHVGLPDKLTEQGYKVETLGKPEILTPMMEVQIRVQKGQEVDRNLLVQAVLGNFIHPVMLHKNSARLAEIIHQITANVPEQAVENLIANYQLYGVPIVKEFVRERIASLHIMDPDLAITDSLRPVAKIL